MLSLLSHILPIFLTINIEKLNKIHISSPLLNYGYHEKRASHKLWISIGAFFFSRQCQSIEIVVPSPVFSHLTQRVWNSPSYPRLVSETWNDSKTVQRCHRQAGWKAISGEMDMDINILIGCFVITVKKIVHNVMKCSNMEEKEKQERKKKKKEGKRAGVCWWEGEISIKLTHQWLWL